MRQCKIACNATNSAAVDEHGRLWVWGSGKFGLLGKREEAQRKINQMVPVHLQIPPRVEGEDKGHPNNKFKGINAAYSRKEPLNNKKNKQHVVKDIAMGSCHMAVIAIDEEIQHEIAKMSYAKELFQKIRSHFLDEQHKKLIMEKIPKEVRESKEFQEMQFLRNFSVYEDSFVIECALMQEFASDYERWPSGSWQILYDMLFKTCKINFSEQMGRTIDNLQRDLHDGSGKNKINLKLLRDCILGKQQNHTKIWIWGLKDERVGQQESESKSSSVGKRKENQEFNDSYIEPTEFVFSIKGEPTKVVCGQSFSLILTKQNQVWSWGIDNSGSLGLGSCEGEQTNSKSQNRNSSTVHGLKKIEFTHEKILSRVVVGKQQNDGKPQNVLIKAIASGSSHCLALTTNGSVYSWGNGEGGRLGHGNSIGKDAPTQIMALAYKIVEQIACGHSHSACITADQVLYIWGVGLNGRLGLAMQNQNTLTPQIVQDLSQMKIERVFLGMDNTFVIDKSQLCYVWGSGRQGKLGLNSDEMYYNQPRKLFTMSKEAVSEFAAGPFHTLALTQSGKIYVFGNSKDGKLGILKEQLALMSNSQNGDLLQSLSNNVLVPTQLEVYDGKSFVQFTLKQKKPQVFEVYKMFKQFTDEGILVQLESNMPSVIQTVCSHKNSYFLLNNGQMFACGSNDSWQCTQIDIEGDKDTKDLAAYLEKWPDEDGVDKVQQEKRKQYQKMILSMKYQEIVKLPRQIRFQLNVNRIKQEERIKHIAAGSEHVIVTTFNGQCYVWGNNSYGQLGIFDDEQKISKPKLVDFFLDRKMKMAAAGSNHSLFLSELGQVFSAGFNEFGQLGIGEGNQNSQPDSQNGIAIDQIEYWVTSMKETSIKQINGLEGIRYIAANGFHSLALSDIGSTDGPPMALYSWGWSAYGQLGHSSVKDSYNLRKPKRVKFRQAMDTKVAFVAAGPKHTLCIDTEGNLWYFGNKESVGIEQIERNQFEPILLKQRGSEDPSHRKGFIFVAASETNNYVISAAESKLFNFGKALKDKNRDRDRYQNLFLEVENQNGMTVHTTDFELVKDFRASFVSCGPNHNILIKAAHLVSEQHTNGLPYAWGDNKHYRFGKLDSKEETFQQHSSDEDREDKFQHEKETEIKDPRLVYSFDELFRKEKKNIELKEYETQMLNNPLININASQLKNNQTQNQNSGMYTNQQDVKQVLRRIKFRVQEDLQNAANQIQSKEMVKKDCLLHKNFITLCKEFHYFLKKEDAKVTDEIARAQDALITRVFNFPTPIDTLQKIENNIPKFIVRNRQIYEMIFTQLQVHPCYLINWITQCHIEEAQEIARLVHSIFGQREIVNNKRVIHTLMVVASEVFKADMAINTIQDVTSLYRTDSAFKVLFNLIFESQTQNLNFNKAIISNIIFNLHGFIPVQTLKTSPKHKIKDEELKEVRDSTLKFIDRTLRESIDQFNQTQMTNESSTLSIEILSLLSFIYQQLGQEQQKTVVIQAGEESKQKNQKKDKKIENLNDIANGLKNEGDENKKDNETIVPYLLDLLFSNLLKQIQQLDYRKIDMEHWDRSHGLNANSESFPPQIWQNLQQHNVLQVIVKSLENSFRCKIEAEDISSPANGANDKNKHNIIVDLKTKTFSTLTEINEIAHKIFFTQSWKPLRFDLLLLKQLFISSHEIKDPILTINVGDIIQTQNSLIDFHDRIMIKDHDEDPIRILLEELGSSKIGATLSKQILNTRINLRISSRLLLTQKKFVKCRDCCAPVSKIMIPQDRFKASYYGIDWKCEEESCKRENAAGSYICANDSCATFMPIHKIPTDLVFNRFLYRQPDENMADFRDVLIALPIIEENGDVVKIIEEEIKYLEEKQKQKKQSDTENIKKSKLKKFKDTIEAIVREKEQEGMIAVQQLRIQKKTAEETKKLALLYNKSNFLNGLAQKIDIELREKAYHNTQIIDYESLITQIKQMKQSKVVQNTQTITELNQILFNSYTGLSSEFLRDILKDLSRDTSGRHRQREDKFDDWESVKQIVWAGRLHLNEQKQAEKEMPKKFDFADLDQDNPVDSNKITAYFNEIGKMRLDGNDLADQPTALTDDNKNGNDLNIINEDGFIVTGASKKGNRSLVGTFETLQLQQIGVIKEIPNNYDFEVLRESKFIFNDNGAGGFNVELSYHEPNKFMSGGNKNEVVVLESFEISREQLCEMRRNFACQVVAILGKTKFQFRVFELLKILNKVISQNNIFAEAATQLTSQAQKAAEAEKKKKKERLGHVEQQQVITPQVSAQGKENPNDLPQADPNKKKKIPKAKSKGKQKKKDKTKL